MPEPEITVTTRTVYRVECECGRTWETSSPEAAAEKADSHREWHRKYGSPDA